MILTEGQAKALKTIKRLTQADDRFRFGILRGYAGTGKTSLLKVIASELGQPLILTPTGKAALRVTEATGLPAQTIHRWLYAPTENPETGETEWNLRPLEETTIPTNRLIVIDEASMVSQQMWDDILAQATALSIKVLLVGDSFQLPPVAPSKDGTLFDALSLDTPFHSELTEVVRQALDSPIIRATMKIRESSMATVRAIMDDLVTIPQDALLERSMEAIQNDGAVIVHKNITRHDLNRRIRKRLGHPEEDLSNEEPLLVLYNCYDIDRFNGEIVGFKKWIKTPGKPFAVRDPYKNISAMVTFGLAEVDDNDVIISQEEVFAQTYDLAERFIRRAGKQYGKRFWGMELPVLNANLGYALTAHKSQGSEYDHVIVVVEPSVNYQSYQGRRWLYTSLSRSKNKLEVCFPRDDR